LIRARSEPLVRPLVIFIDLDKFRAVNQAVGLVVGDSLLIAVARRLQRLAHGTDTLARLGGDRFGLLIIGARDEREQRMLAEDVRAAIKAPIVINGQEIVLTGSIGLAQHEPRYPSTASDLVANAEAAMLRARRSGPDRIESFQASAADQHNPAAELNDELAAALERRQIKVHFRPIVHLHTEGLAGFEACARWEHPRLGLVDPMRLDVPDGPVALRLGATLVQAAAAEVQRWRKEFDRPTQPLFVCLDIGRASLRGPELVQEVRHLIQRGGLAKGALRLEVAETLVMDNPEQANETLLALTQAGARVVLDDFGAGYSSLSYLAQFPIDGIKIDAGLVAAATRSAAGTAIVRSIVALAHELGKTVVADGVDGEDMVGLLRTIGCDMAQGDYYGPVTPAREAMQRVKQERRSDRRNQRSGLFRLRPKRSEADGTDVAVTAGEAGPADGEAMGRLTGKRPAAPMAAAARRPSPATPVAAPPSANGTTGLERPAAPLPPQTPVYVPRPEIRASANHAVEEADRTLARLKEQMARSVAAQPPQPPSPARAEPQPALTASQPSLTDMLAARVQSTSPPAAAPPAAPMPPQALPMPAVAPAAAAPAAPPLPATQPAPPLAPRPAAPPIDLSGLPPAIAASMAKLAQQKPPPRTGSD
jgi:diguanylate cyclase (GGDEF)-like protein